MKDMAGKIDSVDSGSVTTPRGFSAGATYAGLKTYAEDKLDLGILLSDRPSSVAGVFTTSTVKSPSVVLTQERVSPQSKVRALVVNSGIANACVGEQGYLDAQETTAETARRLGLGPEEVLMGSTGIIGVELPMALVRAGISQITPSEGGGNDLARAIMTTDTHPKEGAVAFECFGKTITIGGHSQGRGHDTSQHGYHAEFHHHRRRGGRPVPATCVESSGRFIFQHAVCRRGYQHE